jgi:G3E family GTPase
MSGSSGETSGTPSPRAGERHDPRTPVTVLTGFLGSGKTTLLNAALRDPAMANTAVIINEFGDVSIDHALMTSSDDTITVLENGCLCCTVFGDLVGALNRLYHAREAGEILNFDHVVIETSGLADPAPVLQAFLSEPTLAGLYRVVAVVSTFDAVNGEGSLHHHGESVRQAALADRILITKLDIVPEEQRQSRGEEIEARLSRLNPAARIHRAGGGGTSPVALLRHPVADPSLGGQATLTWLDASSYEQGEAEPSGCAEGHGHVREHNAIAAFCLVREEPSSREALQLLLSGIEQNLGANLLRVKGLVSVAEAPDRPAVIQGAQHLLHNLVYLDRWPDADRRTRIVFITQDMDREALEEMVTLLDRVAARTAAARQRAQGAEARKPAP